ncbi:hypothetical protein [Agromyces sp. Soil535]|uniref:hypothetical protein n=1 Tax=Agromyces sp. Soil535 TaxID=1736390 RepID=UPI000715462D|nr:hypothetical protein [Agromyces sp. Soil535]KRE28239.1 hypothetical protein ASG80_21405 [Agromyces sp. Soil535]
MIEALQTGTLFVLVGIFIARARSAIRTPAARLSWFASGVGALAMTTLGTVIPQSVIDSALGGSNAINLAQNLLATAAFWLVTQAAVSGGRTPTPAIPWWELILALSVIAIPFFFITRDPDTSYYFLVEHIHQTPTWLYASMYMAVVALVSIRLFTGVRHWATWPRHLFRFGAVIVILACLDEIASLTLDHFDTPLPALRAVAFALFDPLFYGGVLIIVAGIASVTLKRWWREARLWASSRRLQRIASRRTNADPVRVRDLGLRLYYLVIQVRDLAITNALSAGELKALERGEVLVSRTLATRLLLDETTRSIVFSNAERTA